MGISRGVCPQATAHPAQFRGLVKLLPQMSDSKVKMHQIQFRIGLRPDPAGGAYNAPQTHQLDLRSLRLREGEEKGGS